jgi:hypothetical protein
MPIDARAFTREPAAGCERHILGKLSDSSRTLAAVRIERTGRYAVDGRRPTT